MKKNETAWYNENELPKDMVERAIGKTKWLSLENSDHFNPLNTLIIESNPKKIADIGCGAGELGRVYNNIDYVGFDLPHIVDNVAKKVNPNLKYNYFDAYDYDYRKLREFDLIICNSFISELTKPIEVLRKILKNTENYLIIHRQYFTNEKTVLSSYNTYGGLSTTRSHINKQDFNGLLTNHKIIKDLVGPWGTTLLIKKHVN